MGVWKSEDTVITNQGLALLGSITGSNVLKITRAVAGDDKEDPAELTAMTDITHIKQVMTISGFQDSGNGNAYCDVSLNNADVSEGYFHQQIGLFAQGNDGKEVLFIISQAATPDYIPDKSKPITVTHRIYIDYSSNKDAAFEVSFAGFVTQADLARELQNKEDAFEKGTAFNRDFCSDKSMLHEDGETVSTGNSITVPRADHVHPIGNKLKYAENAWPRGDEGNYCPDTSQWVMSNGRSPTKSGNHDFEATFTSAWEDFHVDLSKEQISAIHGQTIVYGVTSFTGANAQLEIDVNGGWGSSFTQSSGALSAEYSVPASVSSMKIRLVVTGAADLHAAFTGVYIRLKDAPASADSDEEVLFLQVRKVAADKLPESATPGTLYITEAGDLYLGKDDNSLLALAGSKGR